MEPRAQQKPVGPLFKISLLLPALEAATQISLPLQFPPPPWVTFSFPRVSAALAVNPINLELAPLGKVTLSLAPAGR